jgi:hypothetical protein
MYTRAVFALSFISMPTNTAPGDTYGLRQNMCWPRPIAPDDPGFALLTDDPYYSSSPGILAASTVKLYAKKPGAARIASAKSLISAWSTVTALPRRWFDPTAVELNDAGLLVDSGNVTRRVTDDEIEENMLFVECADVTCEREKEQLGEQAESVIFIPGTESRSSPPVDVIAATTAAGGPTTLRTLAQARSTLSPDLPQESGK